MTDLYVNDLYEAPGRIVEAHQDGRGQDGAQVVMPSLAQLA